jgi:hypothetical protein
VRCDVCGSSVRASNLGRHRRNLHTSVANIMSRSASVGVLPRSRSSSQDTAASGRSARQPSAASSQSSFLSGDEPPVPPFSTLVHVAMALLTRHQAFSERQLVDFVRGRFTGIHPESVPMFVAGVVAGAKHVATQHFVILMNSNSSDPYQRGHAGNASSDMSYWISGFAPEPADIPDLPPTPPVGPANAEPQRPQPAPAAASVAVPPPDFDVHHRRLPVSYDSSAADYDISAAAAQHDRTIGLLAKQVPGAGRGHGSHEPAAIVGTDANRGTEAPLSHLSLSSGTQHGATAERYRPEAPDAQGIRPPTYYPSSEEALRKLASDRRNAPEGYLHHADTSTTYVQVGLPPLMSTSTSTAGYSEYQPGPSASEAARGVPLSVASIQVLPPVETPSSSGTQVTASSGSTNVTFSPSLTRDTHDADSSGRAPPHNRDLGSTSHDDMPDPHTPRDADEAPQSSGAPVTVSAASTNVTSAPSSVKDSGFVCSGGLTPPRDGDAAGKPTGSMPPPQQESQLKRPKKKLTSTVTSQPGHEEEGRLVIRLSADSEDLERFQDDAHKSRPVNRDRSDLRHGTSQTRSGGRRRRDSDDSYEDRYRGTGPRAPRSEESRSTRSARNAHKCGPLDRPSILPPPLCPLPFLGWPQQRGRRGNTRTWKGRSPQRAPTASVTPTQSCLLTLEEVEEINRYRENLKRAASALDRETKRPERRKSPRAK